MLFLLICVLDSFLKRNIEHTKGEKESIERLSLSFSLYIYASGVVVTSEVKPTKLGWMPSGGNPMSSKRKQILGHEVEIRCHFNTATQLVDVTVWHQNELVVPQRRHKDYRGDGIGRRPGSIASLDDRRLEAQVRRVEDKLSTSTDEKKIKKLKDELQRLRSQLASGRIQVRENVLGHRDVNHLMTTVTIPGPEGKTLEARRAGREFFVEAFQAGRRELFLRTVLGGMFEDFRAQQTWAAGERKKEKGLRGLLERAGQEYWEHRAEQMKAWAKGEGEGEGTERAVEVAANRIESAQRQLDAIPPKNYGVPEVIFTKGHPPMTASKREEEQRQAALVKQWRQERLDQLQEELAQVTDDIDYIEAHEDSTSEEVIELKKTAALLEERINEEQAWIYHAERVVRSEIERVPLLDKTALQALRRGDLSGDLSEEEVAA